QCVCFTPRRICRARISINTSCTNACFFFFQAEDGIRDRNVTGVQTCALPILIRQDGGRARNVSTARAKEHFDYDRPFVAAPEERSEERRVGKECRCGWAVYD